MRLTLLIYRCDRSLLVTGSLGVFRVSDDVEEELKEKSRDRESAETELTSDMTLLLSDEDDVTPVGSPSPVFPEERPVLHVTAASPGTSESTCRYRKHRRPHDIRVSVSRIR